MAALNRDLINFEEVEEVIKIRKDDKAQEYVEKYVISKSLHDNLLYMFDILSGATHKSFNVVGNYGTGKSHFLAFVGALLEHPEYRKLVKDPEIAQKAQQLDRKYLIVKFELGAAKEIPLRHIFFDQLRQQLGEKYDIDVRDINLRTAYDNKQNILDVLSDIKEQDPEAGLVVIVDEISDFLKQKNKEEMSYDLALLRELGEVSQDSDFLYIGAMQEHVFTNPKYVEQAESIARINQRFVTITITKEDISLVLANRVVQKDKHQRNELEVLFSDYKSYFTNFASQIKRYIDLFPIHPYVIDVFEQLPYFENRGIIDFAVQNTKAVLDVPAPAFITYDRVFDFINAIHEIRNQPSVAGVVDVIKTLEAKVDLLDPRFRDDAKKLIKALAVLRLIGGNNKNGATSQELANTLLITPPSKTMMDENFAVGNIERIMKNIREVTVGQYIDYGEGRYYLNLDKIEDYDARIEQKAQSSVINNPAEIEYAFQKSVTDDIGLAKQAPFLAGKYIYADTVLWSSKRSFRPGLLIIGKGDEGAAVQHGDYRFVIQGPGQIKTLGQQNEVILSVELDEKLIALLVRARAAEMLADENVLKKVMTQLSSEAYRKFVENYLAALLKSGVVTYGGHKQEMSKLPSSKPLNTLSDLFEHVKSKTLDTYLNEKYPNHPTFNTVVTAQNIASEMSRALQSLDRQVTTQLDLNSRGYLESFGAMKDGHFSASNSPACQLILDRIDVNDKIGKVTPLDDILTELSQKPWGYTSEMTYLVLGALLFNGYLIFVRHGGSRLHAGDVSPMLKQGLDFFKDIRYLERDKDIDVEAITEIFNILGLQAGLVRDKDSRTEAVKALHEKGIQLKEALATLRQGMQTVIAEAGNYPDVPWLTVQEGMAKLSGLEKPFNTFAEVTKVSDLGRLDTSPEFRQSLKTNLANMETLAGFLADWREGGISAGLLRMQQGVAVLPKLRDVADAPNKASVDDLERIASESKLIYSDSKQILAADYRRPLKGKLEQFRQKYDQVYYNLHSKIVGDKAPWSELASIKQSVRYQSLGRLKGLPFISPAPFNQVAMEIQSLERKRCYEFNASILDMVPVCPYCSFPNDAEWIVGLPLRIQAIRARLEELWTNWECQTINELDTLRDRFDLLSAQNRKLIEDLLREGHLPDEISEELLLALYELTSELQPVELDLNSLGKFLLQKGSALKEDELRSSVDEYLNGLLKGYDHQLARIKIVFGEAEDAQ